MKNTIIIIVLALIIIGGYLFFASDKNEDVVIEEVVPEVVVEPETPVEEAPVDDTKTVIGQTVSGNDITAFHFGTGDTELLFVGGIHGGYSWNTALVAYELMDYLTANPSTVPEGVRVTVIPVLNPDGLEKVVGTTEKFVAADVAPSESVRVSGRFNANNVDLNRNFACDWSASATWQDKAVSGGESVFSEPESQAVRDYVLEHRPAAAVVWYSAAGGVYSSNCHNGVLSETTDLTNLYAKASGYPAYKEFNYYAITGDMVNWLAAENIPAISVLLTNHTDTEWDKNKKGIEALIAKYAN